MTSLAHKLLPAIKVRNPMVYFTGDALWMATVEGRGTGTLESEWLRELLGSDICDGGMTPECKATILLRAIKQPEKLAHTVYHDRASSIMAIARVYREGTGIPVLLSYKRRSAVMVLEGKDSLHPDYAAIVAAYKQAKGIR